eukprot:g2828.t1
MNALLNKLRIVAELRALVPSQFSLSDEGAGEEEKFRNTSEKEQIEAELTHFCYVLDLYKERRFGYSGELLFAEGQVESDMSLYVILKGVVHLTVKGDTVSVLTDGDLLGELSALGLSSGRSTGAVCETLCDLAVIHRSVMLRALEESLTIWSHQRTLSYLQKRSLERVRDVLEPVRNARAHLPKQTVIVGQDSLLAGGSSSPSGTSPTSTAPTGPNSSLFSTRTSRNVNANMDLAHFRRQSRQGPPAFGKQRSVGRQQSGTQHSVNLGGHTKTNNYVGKQLSFGHRQLSIGHRQRSSTTNKSRRSGSAANNNRAASAARTSISVRAEEAALQVIEAVAYDAVQRFFASPASIPLFLSAASTSPAAGNGMPGFVGGSYSGESQHFAENCTTGATLQPLQPPPASPAPSGQPRTSVQLTSPSPRRKSVMPTASPGSANTAKRIYDEIFDALYTRAFEEENGLGLVEKVMAAGERVPSSVAFLCLKHGGVVRMKGMKTSASGARGAGALPSGREEGDPQTGWRKWTVVHNDCVQDGDDADVWWQHTELNICFALFVPTWHRILLDCVLPILEAEVSRSREQRGGGSTSSQSFSLSTRDLPGDAVMYLQTQHQNGAAPPSEDFSQAGGQQLPFGKTESTLPTVAKQKTLSVPASGPGHNIVGRTSTNVLGGEQTFVGQPTNDPLVIVGPSLQTRKTVSQEQNMIRRHKTSHSLADKVPVLTFLRQRVPHFALKMGGRSILSSRRFAKGEVIRSAVHASSSITATSPFDSGILMLLPGGKVDVFVDDTVYLKTVSGSDYPTVGLQYEQTPVSYEELLENDLPRDLRLVAAEATDCLSLATDTLLLIRALEGVQQSRGARVGGIVTGLESSQNAKAEKTRSNGSGRKRTTTVGQRGRTGGLMVDKQKSAVERASGDHRLPGTGGYHLIEKMPSMFAEDRSGEGKVTDKFAGGDAQQKRNKGGKGKRALSAKAPKGAKSKNFAHSGSPGSRASSVGRKRSPSSPKMSARRAQEDAIASAQHLAGEASWDQILHEDQDYLCGRSRSTARGLLPTTLDGPSVTEEAIANATSTENSPRVRKTTTAVVKTLLEEDDAADLICFRALPRRPWCVDGNFAVAGKEAKLITL